MSAFIPASLNKGAVFPGVVDVADSPDFFAERLDEIVIDGALLLQQTHEFFVFRFGGQMMQNVFL